MKANELRIGNKVFLYGTVATVQLADFSIGLAVTKGKPIPLTEEWLLRFGFSKIHCEDREDFVFVKGTDGWDFIVEYYNLTHKDSSFYVVEYTFQLENRVEYVHELQNLYFALTGIELKQ